MHEHQPREFHESAGGAGNGYPSPMGVEYPGWNSGPTHNPLPVHVPYPTQAINNAHQGPPIGTLRSTGVVILLILVTCGIYSLVWTHQVHEEMRRHSGHGLGGNLGLLVGFLGGLVSPFLLSAEVGGLYERRGERPPVTASTGCWYLFGSLIAIGPLVWFAKTNGALNAYWRSVGAR